MWCFLNWQVAKEEEIHCSKEIPWRPMRKTNVPPYSLHYAFPTIIWTIAGRWQWGHICCLVDGVITEMGWQLLDYRMLEGLQLGWWMVRSKLDCQILEGLPLGL